MQVVPATQIMMIPALGMPEYVLQTALHRQSGVCSEKSHSRGYLRDTAHHNFCGGTTQRLGQHQQTLNKSVRPRSVWHPKHVINTVVPNSDSTANGLRA